MEKRRKRYEKVNAFLRVGFFTGPELACLTDQDLDVVYESFKKTLQPKEFRNGFEEFVRRLQDMNIVDKNTPIVNPQEEMVLKAASLIMQKYR